jgi:CelD/BcsL family acetyltransferase involved in cellulose biosynthesis
VLDFIIASKREQYRRTARHDIFACRWTARLLHRLWEERTADFGGRVTTLRADGKLIAAEYGLQAGAVRHVWFPTYDPAFSRWGPGTLLMISTARAVGADPVLAELDFGREGESYKRFYAEPDGVVYEGSLDLDPWRQVSARAADATLSAPVLRPLAEVRERMRRRFEIITACETQPQAWLGGAAAAFRDASRRGPALAHNA